MPMFHDNPRRSEPNTHAWYSVTTPDGIREYKLPAATAQMSNDSARKYRELLELAEEHGTSIRYSQFRRTAMPSNP